MIRLVVSDLDGTIVDGSNVCAPSVSQCIRGMRQAGIAFAICSGRPVSSVLPLLKGWGLAGMCDYVIGSNGGEVLETATGKNTVSYTLTPAVIHDILDAYEPLGLIPTLYAEDVLYVQKMTPLAEKISRRLGVRLMKADIRQLMTKPEVKEMMLVQPQDMAKAEAYSRQHPDPRYIAFKTAIDLFEFNHPMLAKDVGVKIIAAMMHIGPEQIIAFGDTTNDIEMLKYVKYGICMANGSPDAKAVAYAVAPAVTEDGFARYLQAHLTGAEFIASR